jgi:glycosyltransferase involved in cell wall biosynthesis
VIPRNVMRVLTVVHTYPPGASGGAEHRAERTCRALKALGHDVRVLSVHWSTGPGKRATVDGEYRGVAVRRLWVRSGGPASDSYDNPEVEAAIRALITHWRPDVVHQFSGYLTSSSVIAAADALGVPVVVSLTDYWWLCHRVTLIRATGRACEGPSPQMCALCQAQQRRRLRWPSRVAPTLVEALWRTAANLGAVPRATLERQRARRSVLATRLGRAHVLLAPSAYMAQVHRAHGVPAERLRVMRQGVEGVQRHPRPDAAGLRVGYLGQVKAHKGVDLLVEAWAELRQHGTPSLVIVGASAGEDDYRRGLMRRTRGWPEVEWHDAVGRDALWMTLAALDVLVVPSRWPENSPNVILEAQAVGLPVVGARLGGIPELIEEGVNGLLFEPDSAADLRRQLRRLIADPTLLERLRHGARPVRSVDDEVLELAGVYRTVAAATPSRDA